MNNSYVSLVQDLYAAIFADCLRTFPDCRKDLGRDLSRLLSLGQTRGLRFYTIDLPAAGKHFDASLASGHLAEFRVPGFGKRSSTSVVPRLLGALLSMVFGPSGVLRSDADVRAIFYLRQVFLACKKVKVTCDDSKTFDSVAEFFRIEETMRDPSLNWDEDHIDLGYARSLHLADGLHPISSGSDTSPCLFQLEHPRWEVTAEVLDTIQRTADLVSALLGRYNPYEWATRHGPGAVADLRRGVSKYSFPSWPAKLESFFPQSEFAFANLGLWAEHTGDLGYAYGGFSLNEPPAKLIAVPKTQKSPRLIASEPVSHQWCQQSLNEFLRESVRTSIIGQSIHFRDQTENQRFAGRASTSGSHWTIDLSSASDRLSLWTMERMFRSNLDLLEAFHASRTRWLVNNIDKKRPKYVKLRKFAAQGAAFTFPGQSIVYYTVVIGAMLFELDLDPTFSNVEKMGKEVRVFGDDIIAPHAVGGTVVKVLEYLGFEVNRAKTYGTGKFRESCGSEWYDGVDVTPAYVLRPYDRSVPTSVSSVVESSNNFYMKGLWDSAALLESTLPEWIRKNLPRVSTRSGAFGLASFSGTDLSHLKMRWNESLQKDEYYTAFVKTNVARSADHGHSSLLQYFTEAPDPDVVWTAGIDSRPVARIGYRWAPVESVMAPWVKRD